MYANILASKTCKKVPFSQNSLQSTQRLKRESENTVLQSTYRKHLPNAGLNLHQSGSCLAYTSTLKSRSSARVYYPLVQKDFPQKNTTVVHQAYSQDIISVQRVVAEFYSKNREGCMLVMSPGIHWSQRTSLVKCDHSFIPDIYGKSRYGTGQRRWRPIIPVFILKLA